MANSPSSPALVFDLDGTLVDTAPDLLGSLNAVLQQQGREPVNHADLRHLVGFGARHMLAHAFATTGNPVDEAALPGLMDAFVVHYKKHIAVASRVFPGVAQTLSVLTQQGARLGVLTNKPQELADLLIPAVNLSRFFRVIHGGGRFAYNKPDARVFHAVTDELGGAGTGALMIGDSKTDVATARAAGVPVVLVSYGYTPEPARLLGADMVIDSFLELPAALAKFLADKVPQTETPGGGQRSRALP